MIGDFVEETANAPGTLATFNLVGPVSGARSFIARFGSGADVLVGMHDGTQGQTCRAKTIIGTPNQIQIVEVLENTAGTTSRLNFTGTTRVYSRLPAGRARGGSVFIREDVFGSSTGAWVASLPAEFARFRVEWEDVTFIAASPGLFARFSINSAASWMQGSADYPQTQLFYTDAATTSGGGGLSYARLTPASVNVTFGSMEFQPVGSRTWQARSHGVVGGGVVHTGYLADGWGGPTPAARATHIMLAAVGTNLAQGRFRLTGIY